MPLDLVGKLHRTVYIEGCLSTVREELLRLLVAKCGAIDGWDIVGERLIVVFSSLNSISTAITFNGTAFGDLTSKLVLWVATESPPAGVAQQLAIVDKSSDTGGLSRSAEELKSAREAREKRLAAIRSELAPDIALAESTQSVEAKRLDLCARQLRALHILTSHELVLLENKLEESTRHLCASQQLLESLRDKETQKTVLSNESVVDIEGLTNNNNSSSAPVELSGVLGDREDVARRVEAMVEAAEDIGKWRKRSREN